MGNPHSRKAQRARLATAAIATSIGFGSMGVQAAGVPPIETKDKVTGRVGTFTGGSLFSADSGGHSAKAGDYAADFGPSGTGPVYVKDGAFLNDSTQNDELAVSFWLKRYDVSDGSAFWFNSPSSNNGGRGFQGHVPWSNANIYFDTSGCCGGDTQRISQDIATFPDYTGDATWWRSWHHFVFSKKAAHKQVWIDGKLFFEGDNTAPLPTDFTDLGIGGQSNVGGSIAGNLTHGVIDDFAIYGTALSEASVGKLAKGSSPTELTAADKLVAFWDFNDTPAAGMFVSVSPAPDEAAAVPNGIKVVHVDGAVPWTQANVTLKVDGASVPVTVTKDGTKATVTFTPSALFEMQSSHSASLSYALPGGQTASLDWSFSVGTYTKDKLANRLGAFTGGSSFTGGAGGRSGKAGDFAADFSPKSTGPVYVGDGAFLNDSTKNNELAVSFWLKRYDVSDGSAFWFNSPGSNNGARGFQGHVPWSNANIYFDTAGCCGGDTQRISQDIASFPDYTGDATWWQSWHFFTFSKKGDHKQVWIDGKLFLEGDNTGALPTDFTDFAIGGRVNIGGNGWDTMAHGTIDDFAIYGTALSEASIGKLASGGAPTDLAASDKLVAYWSFDDMPADGLFSSFTPAKNEATAVPNLVQVVHVDGSATWDKSKVSLALDGSAVAATVTQADGRTTVKYVPATPLAALSKHTATLSYPSGATTKSVSWSFTVAAYSKDVLHGYIGVLTGAAKYSADAGGASGKAGDTAIDFGKDNAGQSVTITDASFLDEASAKDEMAVAAWQKLYAVADSALFWGVSPSSGGGNRGFSAHTPWSNNTLYFDTAGCCGADTQRINAGIDTFGDYSGDATWWQSWHHLIFQKKGSTKEIWIDGKLFLTGDNTAPLPTDFSVAYLAYDPPDGARLRGLLDDFAVFKTAIDEATAGKLAKGTSPKDLPASAGLIAYWNFNDVPAAPASAPKISVSRDGNQLTITSDPPTLPAGWVLQLANSITGPWATQAGATTPITVQVNASTPAIFLRAMKP